MALIPATFGRANWSIKMKILKSGETSRKETIVDAKASLVECHHASAHPSLEKGARFQVKWTIDFTGASQEQILRAAAEYCIIANRRNMVKVSKPKNDDWNNVVFPAGDLIPTPASKTAKVLKTLAAFSPEELAEMGIVLTS